MAPVSVVDAAARGYFPAVADPDAKALLKLALEEMLADPSRWDTRNSLPALREFLEQVAAPDFVCVMRGLPPTPPTTRPGLEGFDESWRDYGETFESLRIELEEFHDAPDHLVTFATQIATTRHGGVEIRQPSAMAFAFEGGLVKRVEFHLDRDEALRSAGIDPQSSQA
jgi:ketosteroid isomerase-like protein